MLELESLAGPVLSQDMVHLSVIKSLNRNLDAVYLEILDETKYGFDKIFGPIQPDQEGWIKFRTLETFMKLTSNLNHRSFIGLPLCRNDEWNKTQERTSMDLMIRSVVLKAFPKSRRWDANDYMSKYGTSVAKGSKMLSAVIEERRAMPPEDKPNDMLSWIMSHIKGTDEASLNDIMVTFNLVDLVAQNITVSTFVHALYHLAASPQYITELREEVMDLTFTGDWTKNAIDRMRKLDSFVRETQRLSGIQNVAMVRVAMQDFSFSNGVRVPKGEMVMAVGNPLHHDPEVYPNPYEFRPFRSLEQVETEGLPKSSRKYDMATPSAQFMAWGLGKHACPGRFYASMVVKHLLAYILVYYEFKFSDETMKAAIKANKAKVPPRSSGDAVENTRPQDFLLGGALPEYKGGDDVP
ncbi:cytochrome P450 [Serendipita vermifera]|nr:cytochrome P450 [Serendipita vermifera]